MGVTIGEYGSFCVCELSQLATELDYMATDFQDAFHHVCKTTLGDWEKATGLSEEQQAEFAERCWVARTKAHEARAHEQPERARIEAEEMRVRVQALQAQKRKDASIVCALVPISGDLETLKYVHFLDTSGILPAVVFPLQPGTRYTEADLDSIQQKLSESRPDDIYISGFEAWKQLTSVLQAK